MSPTIDSSAYKLGDTTKMRFLSARKRRPNNSVNTLPIINDEDKNEVNVRKSTEHQQTARDVQRPEANIVAFDLKIFPGEHARRTCAGSEKSGGSSGDPTSDAGSKPPPVLDNLVLNQTTKNDGNSKEKKDLVLGSVRDPSTDNDQDHTDDMAKVLSVSRAGSFNVQKKSANSRVAEQFFRVEPSLYSHRMFIRAAKIFDFLKEDDANDDEAKAGGKRQDHEVVQSKDIPELDFQDSQEQIKTFELAFATLKFQSLFRGILENTGFFTEYANLLDVYSLVCIVLFDLQSRKFQNRKPFPDEQLDELCSEIEAALLSRKTRLQSHIAKERIKHNAPSIDYLLPEQVRNKDETKTKTPVYLWVNQIKATLDDIIGELEADGFTMLDSDEDISEYTGKVFQVDTHCTDLLIFPPDLDLYFKDVHWVRMGQLVQQDKSSCLAPQTVQHLLAIDQDVIHVNVGTGITTGHLASLLRHSSPHSHIWGLGVDSADKAKKAAKNLEFLGVKNTKILMDDFLNVDPDEPKLKSVKVIMISANCSKSAITSPVQFMVSEGEDMRFLGELSKVDQGTTSMADFTLDHEKVLRHALKFPRVQAVVYSTRSRHEEENELVVNRVLDHVNSLSCNRGMPFRVTAPVLPFSGDQVDSDSSGVHGRFIKFLPSDKSNGCFVAIISREPDDPKDVARSTIARARSKGFFGKSNSEDGEVNLRKTGTSGLKRNKSGSRKLHGPEAKSGFTSKHGHKSPAAISARLHRMGAIQKTEQPVAQDSKPEHLKVVKHPAPFR